MCEAIKPHIDNPASGRTVSAGYISYVPPKDGNLSSLEKIYLQDVLFIRFNISAFISADPAATYSPTP